MRSIEVALGEPSSEVGVRKSLNVLVADTWLQRLIGLIRFGKIDNYTALWLKPCASVHTMWMRFSIDVIFLDEANKILKIKENVRPFGFAMAPAGTCSVLEVAAFNAKRLGFDVNESINLKQY